MVLLLGGFPTAKWLQNLQTRIWSLMYSYTINPFKDRYLWEDHVIAIVEVKNMRCSAHKFLALPMTYPTMNHYFIE